MYIHRSGIAGSCGNPMFNLLRGCQAVSTGRPHVTLPPPLWEGSDFSPFSPALVIVCLLDSGHISGCEVEPHGGFDWPFPEG